MATPIEPAGSQVRFLSLRLLVDDEPGAPGLATEHGFACWVETDQGAVLLDTGLADALLRNALALGLDLTRADALVLSHGHYDHTGGLARLAQLLPVPRVVAHPAFDGPHRSRSTGVDRDVGVPEAARSVLARVALERRREPTEVSPGVWATGEIPRVTGEDVGGPFFLDGDGRCPDPLLDDQALIVRHRAGLVFVLGCAHAGVLNTIRYGRHLFPDVPVAGVVGGMHLAAASADRLAATVRELVALDGALIAPAHCSGAGAKRVLHAALGGRYHRATVGAELRLDTAGGWERS